MARQLEWIRQTHSTLAEPSGFQTHFFQAFVMAPGQTLERIRFKYLISSDNAFALGGLGVGFALGILVYPSDDPTGILEPWDFPNQDWVWYEGATYAGTVLLDDGAGSVAFDAQFGPADATERDVKARRESAPQGSNIDFAIQQDPIAAAQTSFRWSLVASIGILEPAPV